MMMRRACISVLPLTAALIATGVFLASSTRASAPFVVNSLADADDGDCDGSHCTLREAIAAANDAAGADAITFSVAGTITLNSALPDITDAAGLTISGQGNAIAVSGNHAVTVFTVASGGSLSLEELAICDGATSDAGGGILNQGALTVTHCAFLANQAHQGGAIFSASGRAALISSSVFVSNTAQHGGAVWNGPSTLTIVNSTFVSNTGGDGGVAFNASGWSVYMINCTISGNRATSTTVLTNASGQLNLRNTIVASGSMGANCGSTITNGGNNIDSGSSCGWASVDGSMSDTDPQLGALADTGGWLATMAPLPGSPAIDGVVYNAPNLCPAVDQRGIGRPIDGDRDGTARCDIGAHEVTLDVYLPLVLRGG